MSSDTTNDICKNCGHTISGRYCHECGQKANTLRFDWAHIGHQILDSIDIDRGFVHTLIVLLLKPGKAIRGYIEGKRIGFANAFKLFLIVGALTNILTYEFNAFAVGESPPWIEFPNQDQFFKYSTEYFSFFTFTAWPIFSLFSWVLFKKAAFNFIEHLILNLYIAVGQFLVLIFFIPVLYYGDSVVYLSIYGFVNGAYNIWVLVTFFKFSWLNLLASILALALPQVLTYYYNYFIFQLSPIELWEFLDQVLA